MDDPRSAAQPNDLNSKLISVAKRFLPEADAIESMADREDVVRARHDDVWWKVRRWPEATPRSRVEFVHGALSEADRDLPAVAPRILAAPDGETTILANGAVYDAQSWIPGAAVEGGPETRVQAGRWAAMPAVVSDPMFADIVRTVALVHARTAELAAQHQQAEPPLTQLITAVNHAWKAQRGVLRPLATATPAVRRWLASGERALPAAEAAVAAAGDAVGSQTVNHFGLWPAHVIVSDQGDQDAVAGLIGWEHCNVGSPLIDIVQTVSRFRGWSSAGAEMAIAAYGDVSPLRPEERRLLPAIAALDLVATTGQMLIFAYGGRPEGTRPSTALREAARSLLDSLDVATNALVAQDGPKRPANERSRRPGGGARGDRPAQKSRRPRGPQKKR